LFAWHARTLDEHWNQPNLAVECRFDLQPDEITLVLQALRPSLVRYLKPPPSDNGKEYGA
jgi:hypothetical protein